MLDQCPTKERREWIVRQRDRERGRKRGRESRRRFPRAGGVKVLRHTSSYLSRATNHSPSFVSRLHLAYLGTGSQVHSLINASIGVGSSVFVYIHMYFYRSFEIAMVYCTGNPCPAPSSPYPKMTPPTLAARSIPTWPLVTPAGSASQ